jgi:hypothetical protein
MIVTGSEEAQRRADGFLVAPVPVIRRGVQEVVARYPTPNDKPRRDPWARPLGYEADKAVCRLCLRAFDRVSDEHLRRAHGVSPEMYMLAYPDAVRHPAPLGDEEMTTAEWRGWAREEDEVKEATDE